MKFFKKLIPKTAVVIGGIRILFETVDDLTGYYKTEDENILAGIIDHVRNNRYGISEISEQEYETDFVEKKRSGKNFRVTWQRESLGEKHPTSPLQLLGGAAVLAAVSTHDPEPEPVRMEDVVVAPKTAEQKKSALIKEAKVPTGKRPPRE